MTTCGTEHEWGGGLQGTNPTTGDLAALDREVSALVGLDVVVVPQRPGERDMLPGERVRYL